MQDCIRVAYKAIQSTLELFKLEVNYASSAQDCIVLYSNSKHWNYFSKSKQDCIGVAYTATQSILELFKLEVNYSSTLFQQKCKIA